MCLGFMESSFEMSGMRKETTMTAWVGAGKPPRLREQLLLQDKVARELVEPVDDEALRLSCSQYLERVVQTEARLDAVAPRDAGVPHERDELVSALLRPPPDSLLLNLESQPALDLGINTDSHISAETHDDPASSSRRQAAGGRATASHQ